MFEENSTQIVEDPIHKHKHRNFTKMRFGS